METIDTESIAPIKQEWIDNVCMMANVEGFPDIPRHTADEMVDEMLLEMNDLYVHSVTKSIAEYILLNQNERERLRTLYTPKESAVERRIEFHFGET